MGANGFVTIKRYHYTTIMGILRLFLKMIGRIISGMSFVNERLAKRRQKVPYIQENVTNCEIQNFQGKEPKLFESSWRPKFEDFEPIKPKELKKRLFIAKYNRFRVTKPRERKDWSLGRIKKLSKWGKSNRTPSFYGNSLRVQKTVNRAESPTSLSDSDRLFSVDDTRNGSQTWRAKMESQSERNKHVTFCVKSEAHKNAFATKTTKIYSSMFPSQAPNFTIGRLVGDGIRERVSLLETNSKNNSQSCCKKQENSLRIDISDRRAALGLYSHVI